jgi:transcriptional regulator GlxA family with amidase domain
VRNVFFLAGTNPPQRLSAEQIAQVARRTNYQPRQMAIELGLTPRTFERRFRRVFECTPRKWLMQQRMRDGMELLEQGFSTKEVAAQLGFRDRCSLFRVFRLKLRHTPRKLANNGLELAASTVQFIPEQVSQSATFLSQSATPTPLRLSEAI